MAEYYAGAAKGYHSMLMLTIGTGIGGHLSLAEKIVKRSYLQCL